MANSITPPPELSDEQVGNWLIDDGYPWEPSEQAVITITTSRLKNVARQAFQAGADQELEACCETLESWGSCIVPDLCSARRPKPPSAVAQAEALIERYEDGWCPSPAQWHVIREGLAEGRRALEALPDD
jgi:hypothetical protein